MNPKHDHTPRSTRVRCPVCHEAVYSRGGIHPQCAARQSEPVRPKNKPGVPSVVAIDSELAPVAETDVVAVVTVEGVLPASA